MLESQEAAGAAPAVLSVFALTRGLTRSEAAKLFYQVCGASLSGLNPVFNFGALKL